MRHKHGEAFMLMTYACKCGHRETIWNSRDGATPFCTGCPSCCGGMSPLQHVQWSRDTYAPDHRPHLGQRFWRDGTPEDAEMIMRRRIEALRFEYPITPEHEDELLAYARNGDGEFQVGWPLLEECK